MGFSSIKAISWNVNRVPNKVKRYKIISHLKSLARDVAMKTHLNESESLKLKQRWVGQVFSAPGNGSSSILISKKIVFQHTDVISDKNGRYIIVSGFLQYKKITLINIYAPNHGQVKFLSNLAALVSGFTGDPILLGGDMNLVHNPLLDRSSRPLPADAALSAAIDELQKLLGITDVWRCVNPLSREYTFY